MKNNNKHTIEISSNYGFDHNWTLIINYKKGQKRFYLGQDIKFCKRVLNLEPSYICQVLNLKDLRIEKNRVKLANFIIKELGINSSNYQKIESYYLCANYKL